jgi:hypothetical protein
MNPQTRVRRKGDLDADGFSNIEEFLAKTDLKDPKSHPPWLICSASRNCAENAAVRVQCDQQDARRQMHVTFEVSGPLRRTLWIKEGAPIGDTGWTAGKGRCQV